MTPRFTGWITHRFARWASLIALLIVAVYLASFASKLGDVQDNDVASWLPGEAESTKVIERTSEFAPDDQAIGVVAYIRDGKITGDDVAAARDDLARLQEVDDVLSVDSPAFANFTAAELSALFQTPAQDITDDQIARLTSEDGSALQLVITYRVDENSGLEDIPRAADDIREIIEAHEDTGLSAYLGGPLAFGADQAEAFAGIDGILLLAALGVVIVMLLLTYRSPILWLIPLFCGVLGVGAAEGLVYLLAEYGGLTVNGQTAAILAVLVLGASIDYALLLVARYREELRNHENRFEAMAVAWHRAAPAVVASGATVIIGLLCLSLAEVNSTAGLGPVIASGIAAALMVMLLVLPLVLVAFGRWVFWPFVPHFGDTTHEGKGIWARVGQWVKPRPRAVWVTTSLLLGIACLGMTQLNSGLMANEDTFTTEQPSIVADKIIAKHFPAGEGSPVQVVANADAASEVATALDGIDGLEPATQATVAAPSATSDEGIVLGDLVYFERTLVASSDSDAALETVEQTRSAVHALDGAEALVGGQSAINLDFSGASADDNRLLIPLILLVVLVVLGVLLRALLAPILLLATVVLSFGAALGISAVVFKYIFGFNGTDTSFPLYAFVFLVALGIDYNIFLMTRIREEAMQIGTRRGALVGLAATGGVITSAGLVLAGTFAALATLPMVFLAQIGFVVTLGVLLDTLIVRSILVTSLTLDVGRAMWWPSKLWRTDGAPAND